MVSSCPCSPPLYLDLVLVCEMADVPFFELVKPLGSMDLRDATCSTRPVLGVRVQSLTVCSTDAETRPGRSARRKACRDSGSHSACPDHVRSSTTVLLKDRLG